MENRMGWAFKNKKGKRNDDARWVKSVSQAKKEGFKSKKYFKSFKSIETNEDLSPIKN